MFSAMHDLYICI